MFIRNSTISPFFQYALYFLILVIAGLGAYYLIYIGNKNIEEKNRINVNWKNILKIIILAIVLIAIVHLYRKYSILGSTTFALFVSVLIAFLLNPIVNKLEEKGIKRGLGTIITYLGITLIIAVLFIAIIPDMVNQISLFLKNLPQSINSVHASIKELMTNWNIDLKLLDNLKMQLNKYLIGLANNFPQWTSSILTAIHGSIGTLVTLVLIPLITYHFIVNKDKILKDIYNMIPKKIKPDCVYLYKEINFAMNEFVKSRLLMAVFIGVATGIMLQIFGIPFAWVIGFITMILDIVPYIGPVAATTPALVFAFIKSPILFVWIAFLCWVLQWIEQNIVGARLFSVSSGINEIVILLSIIIGGGMFGVWGMILSVPAVIIVKIIYEYIMLKLKGIKPEFTKDVEKAIIIEMKRKEKEELKRRKRNKKK